MTEATPITFVQPCPPHDWSHAPTVGYYSCMKCRRTVMHDEAEYKEIEAHRAAALEGTTEPKTIPGTTSMCPVCTKVGPHNHSVFEVEAFHRANENSSRNFGLVSFTVDEIRTLTARRANGINDRADSRWHP